MPPLESQAEDVNTRTVQLVKLLTEVGPDIPAISRRLSQHKESVRYRYKERIVNRGFAVQAVVDHEKLGLRRMVVILDFAPQFSNYSHPILVSMSEVCFLVSFAKSMPYGHYVVDLSVPSSQVERVGSFFKGLRDMGMLTKLEILEFDWSRLVPMQPDCFDFDTGRWDFDWSAQKGRNYVSAMYAPSEQVKFDLVDLLILKEMQIDANKSLKEVSDTLNVNYKKLAWHYTSHVLTRHLIRGYSVNWMGTRYDPETEKALHRQHRYIGLELLARDLTDNQVVSLRQQLNKIPFLWAEAVGRNYAAQLTFPVDCGVEGMQFITNAIADMKERVETFAIDQTDAGRFTIPFNMYQEETKKWAFDGTDLTRRFEELVIKIKKGRS